MSLKGFDVKESMATRKGSLSPHTIVALWLMVGLVLGTVGLLLGTHTTLPGPTSSEAIEQSEGERLALKHNLLQSDQVLVVLDEVVPGRSKDSFEAARESLHESLRSLVDGGGKQVFTAVQTVGHTWLPSDLFTSTSTSSILLIGQTAVPKTKSSQTLSSLPSTVDTWNQSHPEFKASYLSSGTGDTEMFDLINSDLDRSLIITLPITFVVLLFSFGSIAAALLPIVIALVSLFASLGVAAVISHIHAPISASAAQLVVLLVLAVGVDYSLFFISRVREGIANGLKREDAISVARSFVSPAILWSGCTVALSLVGLLVMNDSILHSMAIVTLAAVMVTVLGTVFVLPSLLLSVGDSLEWGSYRNNVAAPRRNIFIPWVQISLRRPVITLCGVAALLLLAAVPLAWVRLGSTIQPPLLPDSMQSKQAFSALEEAFPAVAGPDLSILLSADGISELDDEGKLQPFFDQLFAFGGVTGPLSTNLSGSGDVVRYEFRVQGSTNDRKNIELVDTIRSTLTPNHLVPIGVTALLGGTLPYAVDEARKYGLESPQVFLVVLTLSFIFLLLAFRSIIIPIKAIILNTLSTGASFGVLVILFQWGGIGQWNHGVVESFVPPLLFAILFGLSMDYHVFLLARIRENVAEGMDIHEAVSKGISSTARTITSAAAIMISVFVVIATLQVPIMKQLGVGLSLAVLIDATLVRALLLPASMVLLGRWNWYLPKFLAWMPRLGIR